MNWRVTVCAVAVALAGQTESVISLSTDVPCDQLRSTGIVVSTPGDLDTRAFTTSTTSCDGGVLGTFVVVPSDDPRA